VQQDDILF
jgi:ABC-type multidrug transport system ATPase subunit